MDLWVMSFFGGLAGSAFMDVAEAFMARAGIRSGVQGKHIGRWAHGFSRGRVCHADIEATAPAPREMVMAMTFHHVVGGGVVALGYPLMLAGVPVAHFAWHVPYAALFGLITCALPWLILMPALGKGVFGRKMPPEASPLLAPILSHLAYGIGLGVTLALYGWLMA